MSVPIPYKLNLTTPTGEAAPGYVNNGRTAYNAGAGHGYEGSLPLTSFDRDVNPLEQFDSGHSIVTSFGDRDLRIDVPPSKHYDVMVVFGDPLGTSTNLACIVSDAGANPIIIEANTVDLIAGVFRYSGAHILINTFLRIKFGGFGGGSTTKAAFIHIDLATEKGRIVRVIAPEATIRKLSTP